MKQLDHGKFFSTEEIEEHFKALIGNRNGRTREEMLEILDGTEFDEHAYLYEIYKEIKSALDKLS